MQRSLRRGHTAKVLRRLGMRPAGGNHSLLRRYVDEVWRIPTDHFDPGAAARANLNRPSKPIEEILVAHSSYSRGKLKQRLFAEGFKQRRCEICGQDERWHGRWMSLLLDHVNGVPDDNRLENLRIVCPNCAATLDTHCGRKDRQEPTLRSCKHCGREFVAKYRRHSYCSHACGCRWDRSRSGVGHTPTPGKRSGRRTKSCWKRSWRRATSLSGASTGRRTTRCASGCASTSDRSSGSRLKPMARAGIAEVDHVRVGA